MRTVLFFAVIAAVLASGFSAELPEIIGEDGLKKVTDSHEKALIMFYAPWCPHCQESKPKFKEAFGKITDKSKTIALVNCDDAKNSAFCNKEKIEGYPTVRLYQKGTKDPVNFEADYTPESIINFIDNPASAAAPGGPGGAPGGAKTPDPPMKHVTYINGKEDFAKMAKTLHSLVFYYAPWCPHCQDAKPKYEAAAQEIEKAKAKDRVLYAINCDEPKNSPICTEQKVEGFPTVRYYKNGELYQEHEEDLEAAAFLKLLSNPPKEKVPPTPVDNEKEGQPPHAGQHAHPPQPGQAPPLKDGEKEMKLTDADRQPEKPEDLMKGVSYLTGANFAQHMTKNPTTLVMYYAPWCPHCVEAKPKFQAANEQLLAKKVPAGLAAMNCDAKENEAHCEKEKVEGFPTLRLYHKGKSVKDYEEAPPTIDGIVKYMTAPPLPKDEL